MTQSPNAFPAKPLDPAVERLIHVCLFACCLKAKGRLLTESHSQGKP